MAANGSFTGSAGALAHLTPRPTQTLFNDNYLTLTDLDFTQQFLPEVYEKEVERYGNRTISGFLRMVGAEMPMASDVVVWSEQGRLHIAYDPIVTTGTTVVIPGDANNASTNLIGPGATIVVSSANGLVVEKAYVQTVSAPEVGTGDVTLTVAGYAGAITTHAAGKVFVYGSEYAKEQAMLEHQ